MQPFSLYDAQGNVVHSKAFSGQLIITFYRGNWCPYCYLQLKSYKEYLPIFEQFGATLIAFSPCLQKYGQKMAEEDELSFSVLSDPGNKVARQFNLVYKMDDMVREMFESQLGISVPEHNGDDSYELPLAATYIINGATHETEYAFVDANFLKRAEPSELAATLFWCGR